MTVVLVASAGLAVGGPMGALLSAIAAALLSRRRPSSPQPRIRSVLLVLLVEMQSGRSILAALQQAAVAFPDHRALVRGVRVATVSGLGAAAGASSGGIHKVLTHLARSQRSGSSAVRTVRSLLEEDIAAERTARLARARSLPVRLMIPVSLLLLPGLMLLLYAPPLFRLLGDVTGPLR